MNMFHWMYLLWIRQVMIVWAKYLQLTAFCFNLQSETFQYPIDSCPRAWQWPLHFQSILVSRFAYSPLKKTERKNADPCELELLEKLRL